MGEGQEIKSLSSFTQKLSWWISCKMQSALPSQRLLSLNSDMCLDVCVCACDYTGECNHCVLTCESEVILCETA